MTVRRLLYALIMVAVINFSGALLGELIFKALDNTESASISVTDLHVLGIAILAGSIMLTVTTIAFDREMDFIVPVVLLPIAAWVGLSSSLVVSSYMIDTISSAVFLPVSMSLLSFVALAWGAVMASDYSGYNND